MEKMVTRLVAIAGIIVLAFNGVDYIRKPVVDASKEASAAGSAELKEFKKELGEYMKTRQGIRDGERDEIRSDIKSGKTEILNAIKEVRMEVRVLDNRIYEIRKDQQKSSASLDSDSDGG